MNSHEQEIQAAAEALLAGSSSSFQQNRLSSAVFPGKMNSHEQEIRAAAEAILTGSSSSFQQNRVSPAVFPANSINSRVGGITPEDLLTGSRVSGRMSAVRRFFCLFVTFDLLFTVLMWIICIMLSGEDVFVSLSKQIVHYSIHTSLFDIVMVAASRFVVLLLFYALLYINHWYIIALSTAGTCLFLIAKVFVFQWGEGTSPVFQVLLILTSFVVSWGEAWFMDFRVLPQESQASQFLPVGSMTTESERAPLLQNYLQSLPRYEEYTESVGNFYSPLASPEGSGDEAEPSTKKGPSRANSSKPPISDEQVAQYKLKAHEILESAWKLLNCPDWRLEQTTADGDQIHSIYQSRRNKIFRVTGTIELPPRRLLELLFYQIEKFPEWNPTLIESRRIQKLDERTDITYQVMAEGAGGFVASRDFVNLRHWGQRDGCYVASCASVVHPDIPKHNKYIRGENGPSCWVMRPIEGSANSCTFQWLLNTDLCGWVPQSILDSAFLVAMADYMKHLRLHAARLHAARLQES